MATTLATTSCSNPDHPIVSDIETVVRGENFISADVKSTDGRSLNVFISPTNTVSVRWTVRCGRSYSTYYTVTVDQKVDSIYYTTGGFFDGGIYSEIKSFNVYEKLEKISSMNVVTKANSYSIHETDYFLSKNLHVLVNNGFVDEQNKIKIKDNYYSLFIYNDGGFFSNDLYFIVPYKDTSNW